MRAPSPLPRPRFCGGIYYSLLRRRPRTKHCDPYLKLLPRCDAMPFLSCQAILPLGSDLLISCGQVSASAKLIHTLVPGLMSAGESTGLRATIQTKLLCLCGSPTPECHLPGGFQVRERAA